LFGGLALRKGGSFYIRSASAVGYRLTAKAER
jgi:hypothetical protein